MAISFNSIPVNEVVPGVFAEIDASKANTGAPNFRTLLIGQIVATGVAVANAPVRLGGLGDAKAQGGLGSMLADMAIAYYANDNFGEVWAGPLADAGGAVAATGSVAFTGPASASGTLSLYIAGQLVAVPVTSGMSASQLATAVVAQIALQSDLPVTAAAASGTVNLTAKNKGLAGNDIDVRLNYLGTAAGESTPGGLVATITPMANGATNPALTTLLANLVDKPFDVIISPFTDGTSIAALTAFLNDAAGRWAWSSQVFGGVWMAYRATYANLATFGAGQNDQHTSVMGFYDSPSPVWRWAAAFGATAAVSLRADPAVPLNDVSMYGVLAPPIPSRFSIGQRNALLLDGISTQIVVNGQVQLESAVTTYQLNPQGQPDNSYRYPETLYTVAFLLQDLRSKASSAFGRTKLAADGTRLPPAANCVTPATIKGWIVSWYQGWEGDKVQLSTVFAKQLDVEINPNNPSRVDVLLPLILVSGLRVLAVKAQFKFTA